MKKNVYFFFCVITVMTNTLTAQVDSVQRLEEVLVSDLKLKRFSEGYKVVELPDSVIRKTPSNLTSLLRFNSTIYLRENGAGSGVSSASFRGTGAAQTAVLWNGININSQLNGQTDFNTIRTSNYERIQVRSGGGSVQYGTGAIGGSIHLTTKFKFSNHLNHQIRASYGSYTTTAMNYNVNYGKDKTSLIIGVEAIQSDNDYQYLGSPFKNENGAYRNLNLNAGFALWATEKNIIKLYQNTFLGTREFSGLLFGSTYTPPDDSFEDENTRSLITWEYLGDGFTSRTSLAHIYELYRYFDNKNRNRYDFGKSTNLIAKYDFLYELSHNKVIQAVLQNSIISGSGSNFGTPENRNIITGILSFKHQLYQKFTYTLNIRQEITNNYKDPLLASVDAKYIPNTWYTVKFNASRNYRIPTYNDLYWIGAGGRGNRDLIPETSMQAEFGQEFGINDFLFSLNVYYIRVRDLIKWQPVSSSVWSPVNIDRSRSYGLETILQYTKSWDQQEVRCNANYGYTVSENEANGNQLIYVPFHKFTSSFSYRLKKYAVFYQFLYNGPVFITTDNTRTLEGYDISNVGFVRSFFAKKKMNLDLEITINNIYNRPYQNVAFRPMPNRNYQLQLTFKF